MKKGKLLIAAAIIAVISVALLFGLKEEKVQKELSPLPVSVGEDKTLAEDAMPEVAVSTEESSTIEHAEDEKIKEDPPKAEKPAEKTVEEIKEALPEEKTESQTAEKKEEKATIPVQDTCFISVSCDTILKNKDALAPEKAEFVPQDGKILPPREVSFGENESAFDILLRVLKEEKIHIEFMISPIYDSVYIEGIGNIYEMDCGHLSGWMYKVNGEFLQTASSAYQPLDGDRIEWVYTCDAGKDLRTDSISE